MIGAADTLGEIAEAPPLPMPQSGYKAGGTFAYLIRIAGREVLVLSTANFIEAELAGVHPDIAIIAPGLREQIRDYSCRLIHVLGDPPIVLATHFGHGGKTAKPAFPAPPIFTVAWASRPSISAERSFDAIKERLRPHALGRDAERL